MATKKSTSTKKNIISLQDKRELDKSFMRIAEAVVSRSLLDSRLGQSYYSTTTGGAKRDLYKTLGYIKNPTFQDYYARFKRGDIGKRIIEALPQATWRKKPTVSEPGDDMEDQTEFEKRFNEIVKQRNVWHYLRRGDVLSGIGTYGIVLLGFDDGDELNKPVQTAENLLYMRPYTENVAKIKALEDDRKSERYGLPKIYEITMSSVSVGSETNVLVDASRVLHLAEGLVDNDINGTPRLEASLNRLQDLDLLCGGSSEMFWRGAFPGYALQAQEDAEFTTDSMAELEEEMQRYVHNLERYMRLRGVDLKELGQQVADPSSHVDVLLTVIACAVGIPKRILLGSERGELASSQDERAWQERIDERRVDYLEPMIIRPFVDKLIKAKVLPEPKEEYIIDWPPLVAMGQSDEIEIAKGAAEAISKYVSSPGADMLVPQEIYLKKYLKFTEDELTQIKDYLDQLHEAVNDDSDLDLEEEEEDSGGLTEDEMLEE